MHYKIKIFSLGDSPCDEESVDKTTGQKKKTFLNKRRRNEKKTQ